MAGTQMVSKISYYYNISFNQRGNIILSTVGPLLIHIKIDLLEFSTILYYQMLANGLSKPIDIGQSVMTDSIVIVNNLVVHGAQR